MAKASAEEEEEESRSQYLVERRWYEHMQRYEADEDPSPPGPIACADHADVPVLVPPSEFERLSRAYGAPDSTRLAELVRQNGSLVPLFEPSHRITLSVSRTSDPSSSASLDLSKDSTLSDLRHDASLALGFDAYDARCIDAFGGRWHDNLDRRSNDSLLSQTNLTDNQEVLFEEKDDDGNLSDFPADDDSFMPSLGPDITFSSDSVAPQVPQENECLSHSPNFVSHFLSNKYENELNADNPIGNQGELAQEYGKLLKLLYDKSARSVAPRQFKQKVGEAAPRFTGYQQQDAQELLVFLLDGLHEDLNRVRQKPYVEQQDDRGRSDDVVAEEHWSNYLRRNDSIVVDLFTGQHKSALQCPHCDKRSITFEPFVYLSLPLPHADLSPYTIRAVHSGGTHRVHKVTVNLSSKSTIRELEDSVVQKLNLNTNERLLTLKTAIADKNRVEEVLTNKSQRIGQMLASEILVNLLPKLLNGHCEQMPDGSGSRFVVIHHLRGDSAASDSKGPAPAVGSKMLGVPFALPCPAQDENSEPLESQLEGSVGKALEPYALHQRQADMKMSLFDDSSSAAPRRAYTLVQTDKYGTPVERAPQNGNAVCDNELFIRSDKAVVRYVGIEWDMSVAEEMYDLSALRAPEETAESPPSEVDEHLNLQRCIQAYTTPEQLEPSEAWFCPHCREHVEASKKLDLWMLPPLLVVHLKRFQYQRLWRQKLYAYVDFPTEGLDLSDFVHDSKAHNDPSRRPVYDLYGVVQHYGSMLGGHYTACAKQPGTGEWLFFDDERVERMRSAEDAKSSAAYLLFYKRRDLREPEGQLLSGVEG